MALPDGEKFHLSFKVVMVGDSGVGKTTLLDGEQSRASSQTEPDMLGHVSKTGGSVGLGFKIKFYQVDGQTFRVQYWDCPGASRYMRLTSRFCVGAAGAIIVFDVNNRQSFAHVERWMNEVDKYNSVIKVLVGNKAESGNREVSTQEATEFANNKGMSYYETNGITGAGCAHMFQNIFAQVAQSIPVPAEPSLLLKRGIEIGELLISDKKYCQSLFLASCKATGQSQGESGGFGTFGA